MKRLAVLTALLCGTAVAAQPGPPVRGLTNVPAVARAYDAILDADFLNVPVRLQEACGAAPDEACLVLAAVSVLWEIQLDPESRVHDARFTGAVAEAIAACAAWAEREPRRAEAWFYLGAAYGARAQWRVLRRERLAAARDGKRIKEALEQAQALDPALDDAAFGIGMYRYYAAVAPAALRMLRWLLLLPGGDRQAGLLQMTEAREHGVLVRGEADFQLHLIYLWYEDRPHDALALVRGLQARYPGNPLFHHLEAEIHDVYFHDPAASYAASARLLSLADRREVHDPGLASVYARLNMADQLGQLGETDRARSLLTTLIAERPARPHGALSRAREKREELGRAGGTGGTKNEGRRTKN